MNSEKDRHGDPYRTPESTVVEEVEAEKVPDARLPFRILALPLAIALFLVVFQIVSDAGQGNFWYALLFSSPLSFVAYVLLVVALTGNVPKHFE